MVLIGGGPWVNPELSLSAGLENEGALAAEPPSRK